MVGYFNVEHDEQGSDEEGIAGLYQTFDCRAEDVPRSLRQEDIVTVTGSGQYRYLRSEAYGNGRVILVLGTLL